TGARDELRVRRLSVRGEDGDGAERPNETDAPRRRRSRSSGEWERARGSCPLAAVSTTRPARPRHAGAVDSAWSGFRSLGRVDAATKAALLVISPCPLVALAACRGP